MQFFWTLHSLLSVFLSLRIFYYFSSSLPPLKLYQHRILYIFLPRILLLRFGDEIFFFSSLFYHFIKSFGVLCRIRKINIFHELSSLPVSLTLHPSWLIGKYSKKFLFETIMYYTTSILFRLLAKLRKKLERIDNRFFSRGILICSLWGVQ